MSTSHSALLVLLFCLLFCLLFRLLLCCTVRCAQRAVLAVRIATIIGGCFLHVCMIRSTRTAVRTWYDAWYNSFIRKPKQTSTTQLIESVRCSVFAARLAARGRAVGSNNTQHNQSSKRKNLKIFQSSKQTFCERRNLLFSERVGFARDHLSMRAIELSSTNNMLSPAKAPY